jgi:hypothetical protein
MKKSLKYIGILLGGLFIFLFGASYFFSPGSGACNNTIVTTSTSPDKKWKLVLFERSCGATTGYSSQISLLKIEEELSNEGGNIYIASGSPKGYSLNWQSNFNVTINGTSYETFKKINQFSGITLTYE